MIPTISRHCSYCKKYGELPIRSESHLFCPHCAHLWGKIDNVDEIFEICPVCKCRQFYRSKDFNQFLGLAIMLVGIILVPFTFGLSLPVFALIDWFLYKRISNVIACYKCGTEFRRFKTIKLFKPFMHHIGLKYDKYR